jgi:hypothetical protein
MLMKEIASPEDQLALWKLISDTTWAALGKEMTQPEPTAVLPSARRYAKPVSKAVSQSAGKASVKTSAKLPTKTKTKAAAKPKRAAMAPAPKPLPQPKPLQLTPAQTGKLQSQQQQQLAQHIQQAMAKKSAPAAYSPAGSAQSMAAKTVAPQRNGSEPRYDERYKDELIMHRRQNPLKPLNPLKQR